MTAALSPRPRWSPVRSNARESRAPSDSVRVGAGDGRGRGDTADLLVELVAEPGMTAAELAAAVDDALDQLAPRPGPAPCRCLPAGVELSEPRCWRCGREVRR